MGVFKTVKQEFNLASILIVEVTSNVLGLIVKDRYLYML